MSEKPKLIDSHCHLDFENFKDDFPQVLKNAKDNGVEKMLTISTTMRTFPNVLKIAEEYSFVYCSVGVHPNHVGDEGESDVSVETLVEHAKHEKVIAIGEAGLDYHYNPELKKLQKESFARHIEAARQTNLALVIHARDADDDMIDILQSEMKNGEFRAVLHCYSSGAWLAQVGLELGLYISFSGIVTFKNAKIIQEIAKLVPDDRFLIETDAPYLAPTPMRGKRNEPAFVKHTAEHLAILREVDFKTIAEQSTKNFERLFFNN